MEYDRSASLFLFNFAIKGTFVNDVSDLAVGGFKLFPWKFLIECVVNTTLLNNTTRVIQHALGLLAIKVSIHVMYFAPSKWKVPLQD